ncbi:MAG: LamG-like jellyroll fold domain-containing protein, partial [Candidatus Thermoplasmatota archaeon]
MKIDSQPLGGIYEPTIYFFDWKENDWLIWQNVKKYFENFDYLNSSFWNGDLLFTTIEKSNANTTSGTKIIYTNEKYTCATIEFRAKIGGDDNYPFFGFADAVPGNNYILFLWNKGLPGVISCKDGSSTFTSTPIINFKDWHIYKIIWLPDSVEFYYDDNLVAVHYTNIPYLSLPIKFRTDTTFMLIDWVKINEDRGMPDFYDARFKQEFKWRYGFKRLNYPNINLTFLMTAHDPYIRVFTDSEHKPEITSELVGFWKFDEGSGTIAKDSSYYSNNGNLNGFSDPPTTYSGWSGDCKLGSCLRFDGSDDYVNCGNGASLNITNALTIEGRLKLISNPSAGTYPEIVGKSTDYTGYALITTNGPKVSAHIGIGSGTWKEFTYRDISLNTWYHIAETFDGSNVRFYINGVEQADSPIAYSGAIASNAANLLIGKHYGQNWFVNGSIDNVRIYNRALSADEIKQHYLEGIGHNLVIPALPGMEVKRMGMKSDYGNDKLIPWNQKLSKEDGNPWRNTGQDVGGVYYQVNWYKVAYSKINSGSSVSFHRTLDYADLGTILDQPQWNNWQHDKTANKYSYEFYLDNDLEETSPSALCDDGCAGTFWTPETSNTYGTGSDAGNPTLSDDTTIVNKGTNSTKIVGNTGTANSGGVKHIYASNQDWSNYEFIAFYLYGSNTGQNIFIVISAPDWDNRSRYTIVDNFSGWKRFVIPLKKFSTDAGSPSLSTVGAIYILFDSPSGTWYLDRTLIDLGQWVKVESFVPDDLPVWGEPNCYQKIYSWDGTTYQKFGEWPSNDAGYGTKDRTKLYFLDGTHGDQIWGASTAEKNCMRFWRTGARDDAVYEAYHGDTITYSSYYGVQKRIGFAIKMPPDNGQDNSTYGISQAKLKLEVYYDDEGKATYEFSNDNNQYYGLKNMLAPYILLYNYQSNDNPLFLTFNRRDYSSSPLFVQADENEVITKTGFNINFNSTWGNNFMFTLGYLGQVDTGTSTSGDANVPDIFEGYKTWQFGNETFESIANSTLTYYDLKDDRLVGWWRFNEGWGTVVKDYSGLGNDGTLTNFDFTATSGWTTDCKYERCLKFDGSDSYVSLSEDSLGTLLTFTAEAWIKTSNTADTKVIYSDMQLGVDSNYFQFRVRTNFEVEIYDYDVSNQVIKSSNTNVADGSWHHLVAVIDDDNLYLYVDGDLKASPTFNHQAPTANDRAFVGVRQTGAAAYIQYFNGT